MAKAPEPTQNERIALDKQGQLFKLEAPYLRAKEYVKSQDFVDDQLAAIDKIRDILRQGLLAKDEALMLIGRTQQILSDLYHCEDVILRYEDIKASLARNFSG